jgi:hypothetical protein
MKAIGVSALPCAGEGMGAMAGVVMNRVYCGRICNHPGASAVTPPLKLWVDFKK